MKSILECCIIASRPYILHYTIKVVRIYNLLLIKVIGLAVISPLCFCKESVFIRKTSSAKNVARVTYVGATALLNCGVFRMYACYFHGQMSIPVIIIYTLFHSLLYVAKPTNLKSVNLVCF